MAQLNKTTKNKYVICIVLFYFWGKVCFMGSQKVNNCKDGYVLSNGIIVSSNMAICAI